MHNDAAAVSLAPSRLICFLSEQLSQVTFHVLERESKRGRERESETERESERARARARESVSVPQSSLVCASVFDDECLIVFVRA